MRDKKCSGARLSLLHNPRGSRQRPRRRGSWFPRHDPALPPSSRAQRSAVGPGRQKRHIMYANKRGSAEEGGQDFCKDLSGQSPGSTVSSAGGYSIIDRPPFPSTRTTSPPANALNLLAPCERSDLEFMNEPAILHCMRMRFCVSVTLRKPIHGRPLLTQAPASPHKADSVFLVSRHAHAMTTANRRTATLTTKKGMPARWWRPSTSPSSAISASRSTRSRRTPSPGPRLGCSSIRRNTRTTSTTGN